MGTKGEEGVVGGRRSMLVVKVGNGFCAKCCSDFLFLRLLKGCTSWTC